MTVHQEYKGPPESLLNDIALVKLPRDAITLLEDTRVNVMAICMPKSEAEINSNVREFKVISFLGQLC